MFSVEKGTSNKNGDTSLAKNTSAAYCDRSDKSLVNGCSIASNAVIPERNVSSSLGSRKSKLILLTCDQTKSLRFPVGTSVWWEVESDDLVGTYNEGVTEAVYFDVSSRDLLYEVTSKQLTEPVLVSEKDLAYAPPCPVFVSPHLSESGFESAEDLLDKGTTLLKGKVLLCKKLHPQSSNDKFWSYSVMIQNEGSIQVHENIPSTNVVHQKASSA
jgi:hypothetical protein